MPLESEQRLHRGSVRRAGVITSLLLCVRCSVCETLYLSCHYLALSAPECFSEFLFPSSLFIYIHVCLSMVFICLPCRSALTAELSTPLHELYQRSLQMSWCRYLPHCTAMSQLLVEQSGWKEREVHPHRNDPDSPQPTWLSCWSKQVCSKCQAEVPAAVDVQPTPCCRDGGGTGQAAEAGMFSRAAAKSAEFICQAGPAGVTLTPHTAWIWQRLQGPGAFCSHPNPQM